MQGGGSSPGWTKEGSHRMRDLGEAHQEGKGERCLEGEAEASQETGLREGNFEEGRGEVMIPEKNKQRNTYPEEHMPRAWNRKQNSSFRFLCCQLITVKPTAKDLAPSWMLLCRGGDNSSIQNSVSSEAPGLWNRDTDCNSQMTIFLFCLLL